MYTVELIIGVILIILGLIAGAYYTYSYTKLSTKIPLLFISEVAATVVIGIFYIVCAAEISKNIPASDLISIETTVEPVNLSQALNYKEFFDVKNFYNAQPVLVEDVKTVNKSDMEKYLKKYKRFYSEMINKEVRNESVKKLYRKSDFYDEKMKRSMVEELDECDFEYKEVHLKYVMLVTSFLYGLIALINSTVEKNVVKIEPNSQMFVKTTDAESISSSRSLKEKSVNLFEKNKYLIQITLAWLIPIIYTIIVYYTTERGSGYFDLKSIEKFMEIQPEPTNNLVTILQKPLNVSTNSKEVNQIVDKVYSIVNAMKNETRKTTETTTYPPMMFDIINYFNNRNKKELLFEKCEYKTMPIKIHTLILFILIYFSVMVYLKTVHTKLKVVKDNNNSATVGKQMLAFVGLWLPSVLEIFIRAYLMDYKPNIYSDLSLVAGNVTRFVTNGFNFKDVKDEQKKHNNINPSV